MRHAHDCVQFDLNNPVFQRQWFALPKAGAKDVLGALRKLEGMTWDQVYQDRGLRWEMIRSRPGPHGGRLYSFRIGKGFRTLACREEKWLRLLSLDPDHDSAYH